MSLREMLSDYWYAFQQELFPRLEGELGPMGERYELFVAVLELVRVEALLPYFRGQVGRPEEDRAALARAFIAKAVFDIPTTRGLIERLEVDGRLWRLCGWSGAGRLPSEATFSRAFSEFAESRLANRLHETLIARTMDGHLVEHISRDATAIEAREKPSPKPKAAKPKRRKRGRPRKGEARAKEPSRLERQLTMSLPQMLADLPRACDVGAKRNAKGHTTSWIGYKLHVDTADGGIPIGCIMTSASTHDSQVAIPLGTLTAGRVENLYDLMDAAYDSIEIWAHCILLGHKPIIDVNPRRSVEMQEALKQEKKARRTLGLVFPEERRHVVRSGSERINGRLKDEFGGRHVRVRGYDTSRARPPPLPELRRVEARGRARQLRPGESRGKAVRRPRPERASPPRARQGEAPLPREARRRHMYPMRRAAARPGQHRLPILSQQAARQRT